MLGEPVSRSSWARVAKQISRNVVAKLIFFNGTTVDQMRPVGLVDDPTADSMAVGCHGSFTDVPPFAGLALGNKDARRLLTFIDMVLLKAGSLAALTEELNDVIRNNAQAARSKVKSEQAARAKQSAA